MKSPSTRRIVIAAVAALALVIVATAAMAATNRVAAAPSNTGPPVVSGTPAIGKELTTTQRDVERHHAAVLQLPVAPLRHDRRKLREHLQRDRQHLQAADGRRQPHAARSRHSEEQRRQRQRNQRPDRRCPRHTGLEQRLSGRQEPEDRPDRSTRTAGATTDRLLRRALRADQQEHEQLHDESPRRQHL